MHLPMNTNADFETTPAGTHLAICYRFVDLGTHKTDYMGQTKTRRLVMLSFELPNELMSDGRPFAISKRYTWSMSDKANLRGDLESWRGVKFNDADFGPGGFDIRNVLGKPCTISVMHEEKEGKTYTNIASIGQVMKGMSIPAMANQICYVSLDRELFDVEAYNSLSDNLKKKIQESPEWDALHGPAPQTYADAKGSHDPETGQVYDERNPPPYTDADLSKHPLNAG